MTANSEGHSMGVQQRFILGGIVGLIGLTALLVASQGEGTYQTGGMLVALLALLVCALLIKGYYDRLDRDPRRPRHPRFASPKAEAEPVEPPWEREVSNLSVAQASLMGPSSQDPRLTTPSGMDRQTRSWIVGALVGVVGLLGLVIAAGGSGFAYWGGLLIFAAAVLAIFRMIAGAFEGETGDRPAVPAPPAGPFRWFVGAIAGVLALLALFAARSGGDAYYIGLILAVLALAYLFLLVKMSFDELERR